MAIKRYPQNNTFLSFLALQLNHCISLPYGIIGSGLTAFISEEKLTDKQADHRIVNCN